MTMTFATVQACAVAILDGQVLQARDVTAGRGLVVDWRTVKSGETLQEGGDAFDVAQLFVSLVGVDVATAAVGAAPEPAPVIVAPRVNAYMDTGRGRRRSFEVGPFTIYVEPHEDDEAQADFTAKLAALAHRMHQGES